MTVRMYLCHNQRLAIQERKLASVPVFELMQSWEEIKNCMRLQGNFASELI